MLGGGISTFTRSKEDILTRKDKNIVIQAILDNLEYLPNPTLYKMSNIEIWKKDENVITSNIIIKLKDKN